MRSMEARRPSGVFAPLNVPTHRRLETLAVLVHLMLTPLLFSAILVVGYLAVGCSCRLIATGLRLFLLAYLAFYCYDFRRPFAGGSTRLAWGMQVLRPWFTRYRAYFPVRALVTPAAERALDGLRGHPRPVILGAHPHGIVSFGPVVNFVMDPYWFTERFPHVVVQLLTLNINFLWPFWREWVSFTGFASVGRESCEAILRRTDAPPGTSRGILIVVGGAKEALDAAPGRADLTLQARRGFFKLALQHGALLFPVFSFGENDVYHQMEGALVTRFQHLWYRVFGFTTPFFVGRGVFNYRLGFIPMRRPITTVVGAPLDVARKPDCTEEDIAALRRQYIAALTALYEEHREQYEVNPVPAGLRIVR